MYFCYLDESGTPQLAAQTSHFILLGLAIPAAAWHEKDRRVDVIKTRYGLKDVEVHTGYIARRLPMGSDDLYLIPERCDLSPAEYASKVKQVLLAMNAIAEA